MATGSRTNLEPSRRGNGGRSAPSPLRDPRQVARGLGWFSIGLGLAECAAPRSVARMIGLKDDDTNRNTLFAYGVREIASGIGILMGDRPVVPVWARVGGDVMDLAFLGRALALGPLGEEPSRGGDRGRARRDRCST